MVSDADVQAAAAARRAKKATDKMPNAVLGGQPIGECHCGERFDYGPSPGADVSNMDPCPGCGSREWYKWGYRYDGEEIRRDKAWDRYDAPPSVQSDDGRNGPSQDTGTEQSGGRR